MLLALIGYRGTGKTTVARRLALALGWSWVDADVEIELAAGRSISTIFDEQGEEGFRDLESDVVALLAQRDDTVLALGGGAVLREANRTALGAATVVWLKADVPTIVERLAGDPTTRDRRPNLTNAGGPTEIERLLAERTPIYRASADLEVDTVGKTPADVAEEILARLGLAGCAEQPRICGATCAPPTQPSPTGDEFLNAIQAIPFGWLLAGLFLLGTVLGGLVNLAVYRWSWIPRSISPWSAPDPKAPPRRWSDQLPIVGWLGMRREAAIHGAGFWVRPMLIELGLGACLAALYAWEAGPSGLYRGQIVALLLELFPALKESQAWRLASTVDGPPTWIHLQYASRVVLVVLLAVASFIDIDEKLIPDEVTVTGTLLGLILATVVPTSLLPHVDVGPLPVAGVPLLSDPAQGPQIPPQLELHAMPMFFTAPNPPPAVSSWAGLAAGLGCFWLWCFAILPRPWYTRHGIRRALGVCLARMSRGLRQPHVFAMIPIGTLAVAAVWWRGGGAWLGLLTALVGLAASGGVVWAVRLIGGSALQVEAMGFGDVLLMMMIGTFIGWQASLLVFFLAPLAALVVGGTQYLVYRDNIIPYGPFLCLATLFVLARWADLWGRVQGVFRVPWLVPVAMLACFVLMWVLLLGMRWLRTTVFGGRS